jgi:hypothetical protein
MDAGSETFFLERGLIYNSRIFGDILRHWAGIISTMLSGAKGAPMLRTIVCAVLALLLVVGTATSAGKKGKGKKFQGVGGKFVSAKYNDKDKATSLTITPFARKKKGEETKVEDKTFIVPDGTPVLTFKGEGKPEKASAGPDTFKDVKAGTIIRVGLDDEKKVTRVSIGGGKRKGGKKKTEQ